MYILLNYYVIILFSTIFFITFKSINKKINYDPIEIM